MTSPSSGLGCDFGAGCDVQPTSDASSATNEARAPPRARETDFGLTEFTGTRMTQ
jgi:hypothetical protein